MSYDAINGIPEEMVGTSYSDAQERGLRFYRGGPCLRGHDGLRYAKDGYCIECHRARNAASRRRRRQGERDREAAAAWRARQPPKYIKAYKAISTVILFANRAGRSIDLCGYIGARGDLSRAAEHATSLLPVTWPGGHRAAYDNHKDPWSPELDHIVAKSRVEVEWWDNLWWVPKWWNQFKRDMELGEAIAKYLELHGSMTGEAHLPRLRYVVDLARRYMRGEYISLRHRGERLVGHRYPSPSAEYRGEVRRQLDHLVLPS